MRVAVEERLQAVLDFHTAHLTEHLWPRTAEEFRKLAVNESLLEIVELPNNLATPERIVGMAYVALGSEPDSNDERAEFGGIFVEEACRGLGLAKVLGIVAISNYFVTDPPCGRLIAHVHEFNELPRALLQGSLGFVRQGQEIPPTHIVPATLQRNANGEVVGHLFVFDRTKLEQFAEWIEKFEGKLGGNLLEFDLPSLTKYRTQTLTVLRALSQEKEPVRREV